MFEPNDTLASSSDAEKTPPPPALSVAAGGQEETKADLGTAADNPNAPKGATRTPTQDELNSARKSLNSFGFLNPQAKPDDFTRHYAKVSQALWGLSDEDALAYAVNVELDMLLDALIEAERTLRISSSFAIDALLLKVRQHKPEDMPVLHATIPFIEACRS